MMKTIQAVDQESRMQKAAVRARMVQLQRKAGGGPRKKNEGKNKNFASEADFVKQSLLLWVQNKTSEIVTSTLRTSRDPGRMAWPLLHSSTISAREKSPSINSRQKPEDKTSKWPSRLRMRSSAFTLCWTSTTWWLSMLLTGNPSSLTSRFSTRP